MVPVATVTVVLGDVDVDFGWRGRGGRGKGKEEGARAEAEDDVKSAGGVGEVMQTRVSRCRQEEAERITNALFSFLPPLFSTTPSSAWTAAAGSGARLSTTMPVLPSAATGLAKERVPAKATRVRRWRSFTVFEVGEGVGRVVEEWKRGEGVGGEERREERAGFVLVFALLRGVEEVVVRRRRRGAELFQRIQRIGRRAREGRGEVGPRSRRNGSVES
jgi:hypothetical protein